MINVTEAKTKELVAFYNAHCHHIAASPVFKFSDRKTAEKRVNALIVAMPKPEAKEEKPAKRSAAEGIAASWTNPTVAAKRTTRNVVLVEGTQYKSMREAWAAMGFDDKKHIKARMKLKAEGTLTVDGVTFTLGEEY